MNFGTSAYQTETPKQLWEPFTSGPGEWGERYADRLTELQAFDLLLHAADDLDPEQQRFAEQIVEDADGDLECLLELVDELDGPEPIPEDGPTEVERNGADAPSSDANPRGER